MIKIKKGFSLIELIIVITVLSFVMVALGGALFYMFQSFTNLNKRQSIHGSEQQMRMALLEMVRGIRESDAIETIEPGLLELRVVQENETHEIKMYLIRYELVEDGDAGHSVLTRTISTYPGYDLIEGTWKGPEFADIIVHDFEIEAWYSQWDEDNEIFERVYVTEEEDDVGEATHLEITLTVELPSEENDDEGNPIPRFWKTQSMASIQRHGVPPPTPEPTPEPSPTIDP